MMQFGADNTRRVTTKEPKHTPWSDEIDLLTFADNQDAEGYGVNPPVRRRLMCTFYDGVSQNEFYAAQKSDLQASAQAEIQRVDYEGERWAEFRGRRFRVIRNFPTSFDNLMLVLSEVIR